jgi:hypothetical protein
MAEQNDPKGYYAALGLDVSAPAAQIKPAYRIKAKALHPDAGGGDETAEQFHRLAEACRILSDPEARARYDASALEKPLLVEDGPEEAARNMGAGALDPVSCSCCGALTAQPRYVIFWRVVSFGIGTYRRPVQGVFCRSCADRKAIRASAVTWLLGWWGIPWGPFWTARALWRNLMGGERPADPNAALLRRQAHYFAYTGKKVLARAAVDQALAVVQRQDLRHRLQELRLSLGANGQERLVDRWQPMASTAFYLQALPMLLVPGALVAALLLGVPRFPLESIQGAGQFASQLAGRVTDLAGRQEKSPVPAKTEAAPPAFKPVPAQSVIATAPLPPSAPMPPSAPLPAPAPVVSATPVPALSRPAPAPLEQPARLPSAKPASPAPPPVPAAASGQTLRPPPRPESTATQTIVASGERKVVVAKVLSLRAGPGAEQRVVGRLVRDDSVLVLEQAGAWVRIKTAWGQEGYVAAEFLAGAGTGATASPADGNKGTGSPPKAP